MRTYTRFLHGLGFLALLAPTSADDNHNTLERRQAPPAGTFLIGSPQTLYINPNGGAPGTIVDFPYTQVSTTFLTLTNSAILTISAQNDVGLFSYDDFSAVILDDPANANIIENSGFETGALLPWYSVSGPGNTIADAGTGNALTGTYGLLVDSTAGQTEVVAQVLTTTANTQYTVSFWVRSVGSSNAATSVTIQSQVEPPIIIGLSLETDDGVSNTDGQTTVANPVLIGIGDFTTQIEISLNGAPVGTTSPLADRSFTFQLPLLPAEGSYVVTAIGTSNINGVQTPVSAPYTFVFSPVPPTLSLDPASDTGNLGDGITSSFSITLLGKATGNSVVNLFDSGALVTSTITNLDGTFSLFLSTTIGAHTYRIFNNPDTYAKGPSNALAITVVTVPDPPILTGLDPASDDGTLGDSTTSILTPTIIGTALAGSTVVLFDGSNAQIGTGTTDNSGNFAITTSTLPLGFNSLYGQQTDINGEISGTGSSIFIFIVPQTPVITGVVPSLGTNGNGDPTTSSLQPALVGNGSPATVVNIYESGAIVGAGDVDPTGSFSALFFAPLSLGIHTFTALSTDGSGYQSEFSQPFTIEVVEPSASSSEVISSTISSDIPQSTSANVSFTASSVESLTLSSEKQSTVVDSTASNDVLSTSADIFSTVSESSTLSAGNPLTTSVESFSSLPSEIPQSVFTSTDASIPSATAASTEDLLSSIPASEVASSVSTGTSVPTITGSSVDVGTSFSSFPAPTEIASSSIPNQQTPPETDLSTRGFSTMSWSNFSISSPSPSSVELETSVPTILPTFQPTTEAFSQTSLDVSISLTVPSQTLSGSSLPIESSLSPSGSVISSSLTESLLSSGSGIPATVTAPSATLSSSESATSDVSTPSLPPTAPFFLVLQVALGLKKRQVTSGSPYLTLVNGQLVATQSCTELPPVAFTIDNDRLAIDDSFATTTTALVANPGYSPLQFQTTQGPSDIQTVFSIDPVLGSLSWTNAGFPNSNAQFCLLNNVLVAAYSVPVTSIPGCVPVVAIRNFDVCSNAASSSLSTLPGISTDVPSATGTGGSVPVTTVVPIIVGVEITIQITIININIVVNGVLVPTTKTETQTITLPLIATPAPSVGSSVIDSKTEYFTTTVACGICQCKGAVPGEITAYRTVTVCPTCKPTPVAPVETVVPCEKCQPLIPGPPLSPGDQYKGGASGGNPYTEFVPAGPGAQQAPPAPVVPGKAPDASKPEALGTVPVVGAPLVGPPLANPSKTPQGDVTGTAVGGQPEKPVEYTGGAATIGATSAFFGILVSILVLLH